MLYIMLSQAQQKRTLNAINRSHAYLLNEKKWSSWNRNECWFEIFISLLQHWKFPVTQETKKMDFNEGFGWIMCALYKTMDAVFFRNLLMSLYAAKFALQTYNWNSGSYVSKANCLKFNYFDTSQRR